MHKTTDNTNWVYKKDIKKVELDSNGCTITVYKKVIDTSSFYDNTSKKWDALFKAHQLGKYDLKKSKTVTFTFGRKTKEYDAICDAYGIGDYAAPEPKIVTVRVVSKGRTVNQTTAKQYARRHLTPYEFASMDLGRRTRNGNITTYSFNYLY